MIRPPAVAGTFYPDNAEVLRQAVTRLLGGTAAEPAPAAPKALIVPHAGYVYSGQTAGQAYARLAAHAGTIRRVILLGPVHQVPVRGLALPVADTFATPLGTVPIDQEAVARLSALPQVAVNGAAHAREHSLEVQVPFLQSVLKDFSLVPLAVGDATAAEVAEVLEALWGGPETLIVVSSDLSHYLPYATAQEVDGDTVRHILDGELLESYQQACGALPINGLMLAAHRHGLAPRLVSQCNSGDTAGDRARVVGYAAFEFVGSPAETGQQDQRGPVLLALARSAIAQALGRTPEAVPQPAWLRDKGATFVTLTQNGQLRGCIGSLEAHRSLLDDVEGNARAAALHDPRFPPLRAEELDLTRIEVSLLSPLEPLPVRSEADALARIRPGTDGLVLEWRGHRGTFLPQVWEDLPDARQFLNQLKRKAGLSADFWADDVRLQRYHVTKWSEPETGRSVQ